MYACALKHCYLIDINSVNFKFMLDTRQNYGELQLQ